MDTSDNGWRLKWLDGGLDSLQLDIVGFLAILGEESVKKTSRLASLSWLFLLPRLMPAPHSLLYTERQESLDVIPATVSSVKHHNVKHTLRHVTAAMLPVPLNPYEVRCFRIQSKMEADSDTSHYDWRIAPPPKKAAPVRAALLGPVLLANYYGCALSIALFTLSLVYQDGMSLIATVLLSLVSSLIGLTNHWRMTLPPIRPRSADCEDAVIRMPNGAFIVLKAEYAILRELLFAPDAVQYSLKRAMHFIPTSIIGTIALMLSVVALANANIILQIAWAGAFVTLNIAHWLAAALPRSYNFSFAGYVIEEEYFSTGPQALSYTDALWRVIAVVKSTEWCKAADATQDTSDWQRWLAEAEQAAKTVTEEKSVPMSDLRTLEAQIANGALKLFSRQGVKRRESFAKVHQVPEHDPRTLYNSIAIDAAGKPKEIQ